MSEKFQGKNPTTANKQDASERTYQTSKYTKPYPQKRYKTTRNIGLLLSKQLKNSTQKRGFAEGHLILNWSKVCPEYASFSAPTKLSHTGTLTLTVSSDSAKQEILMISTPLKERLNSFLGHNSIITIRCITGPLPKKTPQKQKVTPPSTKAVEEASKTCQNLPTSDLKEALIRLGAQIYNKK